MPIQRTLPGIFAEPGDPQAPADDAAGAYADLFRRLVERADTGGTMSELVGALTWTLASIAGQYGTPHVAGDIVRRFGEFLCRIEGHKAAEAEAAEHRANGKAFN